MDFFADALFDNGAMCAPAAVNVLLAPSHENADAFMPPSQESASAGSTEVCSGGILIDLLDDPTETSPASKMSHDKPEKSNSVKRTIDASSPPSIKKPKATATKNKKDRCKLKEVVLDGTASNGYNVTCVPVPRGNRQKVVPLWPLYEAQWRNYDFQDAKWIVVGNYESWVKQIVAEFSSKTTREMSKVFFDKVRLEFHTCLSQARKATPSATMDSDDEADAAAPDQGKKVVKPFLQVQIGGFSVECLNTNRRVVFKLDADTVGFINNWICPLIKELCRSNLERADSPKDASTPAADEGASNLDVFKFTACATPNIREKVIWDPLTNEWKILVKKPKGSAPMPRFVDPALAAEDYEKQKVVEYWKAVQAWNDSDGSPRLRIPVPRLQNSFFHE